MLPMTSAAQSLALSWASFAMARSSRSPWPTVVPTAANPNTVPPIARHSGGCDRQASHTHGGRLSAMLLGTGYSARAQGGSSSSAHH